ncbi:MULTISPECIES: L-glyceraldehyde 3-phosphate reductase [Salegentibacter]|jgi:L-glyceraldehyde 3-phosphate reductase|uniref:L-glyceraldehyde 3-phosphate reductase n=1 Tax=Salegentibacter agarivorans TaxID=345907 RepID=A0A1I2NAA7_9FLAO|nr:MULTISPECIES: L-glyceraldehyde 3-phosphate reductase [Salegentibacter]APS39693.1 L-glyceraldehyde 3-phosphate reductase [Salegentibacter sp. T436]SFF99819.1 L-glyceraldehyde 3-phosphate reductase [Salegentibacter agarivorans]|tara:strand:+ start:551 stop:1549 length:999 start_codon:yes stop_codon:yes gene_type:complete
MSKYIANENRYEKMQYRRCGKSGIKLPLLSLGLWHNFGDNDDFENARNILRAAFNNGITHFDLANNYGPPYGSAEKNFGKIFAEDFKQYRDELLISTKAGWDMWPGPYGNFGSRKYLIASLDQSLQRMGLDYVDIFYHHRPDPDTPLEETMGALDQVVRQGKALYVGISQYSSKDTARAAEILRAQKTPFLIHQPRYNMMDRWVENGLLNTLEHEGIGSIVFSPLEQGILTDKYLNGIPKDSRAATQGSYLDESQITPEVVKKVQALNEIAQSRNQSLAQMAVAWLLKDKRVTSVLVGASKVSQLEDNIKAIENLEFNKIELEKIEEILKNK